MDNLILSTHTTEELTNLINLAVKEALKELPKATTSNPSETLLTRKETADKLKISLVTLNDWTKRGLIQSYLLGGRVFYKQSEIENSLHRTKSIKY
ncbi:helix-turn-helix domain-containing protein [Algoriphagus persicinus]|uniref:helix-turn-helix domain-containing protein n=1 Tax=Algoriphagus persicinus TaxID=3108754 RepID=UPI002B39F6F4|nr:helix-turn-helix domain-containing protein [Algoriphagus sp. E1-3-M2]MEB2787335.1 helix-turn-helix domain-containing protein [Algoriphagus sp. E1-3-M2]